PVPGVGPYQGGVGVNDGGAANNTDETTVTVEVEEDPVGNVPPTADVKADPDPPEVQLANGTAVATLDGSSSSNGAPGIDDCMQTLAFRWTQVDGPAGKTAVIAAPDQPKTTVTFDFPGDYTIELLVDDGQDAENTAPTDVMITVT